MKQQSSFSQNINTLSSNTPSDSELVAKVRNGDISAFETIIRRYNQQLYRIARSILRDDTEAQDAVQETHITAYYQLHQFKGPDGFAGWLSRIVRNEAMMRIRKSRRIVYLSDDAEAKLTNSASQDIQPADYLAGQQLHKLIENAIDLLPISYRSVYVMRAIQQLSTSETALSLELSEDVVKTQYSRAKRALRKSIEVYLDSAGMQVFEFAGYRCDSIVKNVLKKITN